MLQQICIGLRVFHNNLSVATWNVNSLRVRLEQVMQWLEAHGEIDVLAVQETKVPDSDFPLEVLQQAGYHVVFSGQKSYNGVAMISRYPLQDIQTDVDYGLMPQCRVLGATFRDTRIVNVYVPNGAAVGTESYEFKLNWFKQLASSLQQTLQQYPRLIVMGDFNVAPEERDVHDPLLWQEQILCSTPERAALQKLIDLGLKDTFRLFEQAEKSFSWWDYRGLAFRRNHGLRIDLILASHFLAHTCTASMIDRVPRQAKRSSDHVPVIASFS